MLTTRPLSRQDSQKISAAFRSMGWTKSVEIYERYLHEATMGRRWVRVASIGRAFAGYVTVVTESGYEPFRTAGIPEIQDLNVLPAYRRRGIAGRLLDECEAWIAERSEMAGIGVRLHPGYNAAQRLYVRRGYVPDGRGVTSHGRYVKEGELIAFDDGLVLWLTKPLGGGTPRHSEALSAHR
jgi:GNAT superfamily N-acetyltransferase